MTVQRVDFYQLSRDPVEHVVGLLASKVMDIGERLLIVAEDEAQRALLSKALWEVGGSAFLAHGEADDRHAARQPILLSPDCEARNGARIAIFADGRWREGAGHFDRILLLFDTDARDAAAELWRRFQSDPEVDNRIHKQDERGNWREGR